MANSENDNAARCNWNDDGILSELENNVNSCVCITTTGGCSFSGLLTDVNDDVCTLICRNRVTVCRLDDVQSVTFSSRTWC